MVKDFEKIWTIKNKIFSDNHGYFSYRSLFIFEIAENQCPESSRRKLEDRRKSFANINLKQKGVGGLDDSFQTVLRRTFQSRLISPVLRKELGLTHVKGVMLYGPPGCGKTLIARLIGDLLDARHVNYVNAPEMESKFVGESEKNIRNAFARAVEEFNHRGDEAALHVVIFDEIDAITRHRGGHNAKARDGALHQLLCELDGLKQTNNIIVFGLTNRIVKIFFDFKKKKYFLRVILTVLCFAREDLSRILKS